MWILHSLAPSTFSILFETSMSCNYYSYTYYRYNNLYGLEGPFYGYNTEDLCYDEYCTSNSQCKSNSCTYSSCDSFNWTAWLIFGPIIAVCILIAIALIVCHRLKSKTLVNQLSHHQNQHQDSAVTYQAPQPMGTVLVS